jgi:hypothetical protein
MMPMARLRRWLRVALLTSLPAVALAQTGVEGAPPQPLTSAVELRLAGAHRFRIGIVANNAGDFMADLGRLATLIGDGTVVPVAEGFFWRIVISRSQVDGHSLADADPLMELEMVTDSHGNLLGQETRFGSRLRNDPDSRRHEFYLTATALWLGGGVSALLPATVLKQGSPLGSLQAGVAGLLDIMAPGVKLSVPPPPLVVTGARSLQGRQAAHAAARGPVNLNAPLGAVTIQSEAQADVAIDSGLPLSSQLKLTGRLPGTFGQMDFSVRATLRPY